MYTAEGRPISATKSSIDWSKTSITGESSTQKKQKKNKNWQGKAF